MGAIRIAVLRSALGLSGEDQDVGGKWDTARTPRHAEGAPPPRTNCSSGSWPCLHDTVRSVSVARAASTTLAASSAEGSGAEPGGGRGRASVPRALPSDWEWEWVEERSQWWRCGTGV